MRRSTRLLGSQVRGTALDLFQKGPDALGEGPVLRVCGGVVTEEPYGCGLVEGKGLYFYSSWALCHTDELPPSSLDDEKSYTSPPSLRNLPLPAGH